MSELSVDSVQLAFGERLVLQNVYLNCLRSYRIPEPTRQAHILVNKIRGDNSNLNNQQYNLF